MPYPVTFLARWAAYRAWVRQFLGLAPRLSLLLFADFRDMTTASSSSSYANALRGAPGPCAPVQALPLYHAPLFQENTIFVNLCGAVVDYTQKERDSFLLDDPGLRNEDVLDLFLDPSTLHLRLTLATSALFAAILDRLFAASSGWRSATT